MCWFFAHRAVHCAVGGRLLGANETEPSPRPDYYEYALLIQDDGRAAPSGDGLLGNLHCAAESWWSFRTGVHLHGADLRRVDQIVRRLWRSRSVRQTFRDSALRNAINDVTHAAPWPACAFDR